MNLESGHEGRKVRAPQGRVVRNPDCSRLEKGGYTYSTGGDKESATEKRPPTPLRGE